MAVITSDPTTAELGHEDLLHDDGGYMSPAMRRNMSVPGAHALPGGMTAAEAFAIGDDGVPFDMAGPDEEAPEETREMSERELIALLDAEEADAIAFMEATVSQERAEAMDYYYGREFGNEDDNESTAIETEVFDAVEGMLPGVLKPFVSQDDVVAFEPESDGDAEAAEQETAFLNYTLMRRNDGFGILRKWVWDGLAQKNGVVKYWWDTIQPSRIERLWNVTLDVLAMLMQDGDVEILEATEKPAPVPPGSQFMGGMVPPVIYDVVLRVKDAAIGQARVTNVPPEEFVVSRDAVDANPKLARFCEHRRLITISELRQILGPMGIEVPDDITDAGGGGESSDLTSSPTYQSRHADDSAMGGNIAQESGPNRVVLFKEQYPTVDFNGDGIAERRIVMRVGDTILLNEEIEEAPFSGWTPYPIPHKYYGVSVADLAMDFQLQKSTLKRQLLNNTYAINNNRMAISTRVNQDDVLNNVVSGFVRVNGESIGGDIVPLAPVPIADSLLPVMQYMDQAKESRIGHAKQLRASDANSLKKTATEVTQDTNASEERTQLIARTFAETGLKDLMLSLHGLIRRHGCAPETFKMLESWVTVDPREWRHRRNLVVNVGLGTSDRDRQAANYQAVMMMQQQAMGAGLAEPEHLYNAGKKWLNAIGEKNIGLFMKDPKTIDPAKQPPKPPPESVQVQMAANEGIKAAEGIRASAAIEKAKLDNASKEAIEAKKMGAGLIDTAQASAAKSDEIDIKQGELLLKFQEQQHRQQMEIRGLVEQVGKLVEAVNRPAPQVQQAPQQAPQAPTDNGMRDLISQLIEVYSADRELVRDPQTGRAAGTRIKRKGKE